MPRDYASLQRKPFLTPIWLSFLTAAVVVAILGFAFWAAWVWITADSTTIVVIHHAEYAAGDADPPLAPKGEARAELLARMFGDARPPNRLDAIYTSPARGSRMTAAPLASRLGIAPMGSPADPRVLVHLILHEHAGGRILVIADSVTDIVSILSPANHAPPVSNDDFGAMYIIAVPRIGSANLMRVTY